MSNRYSDILFQLIHSLEKAEKRHFKLYIKRSSGKEDLKITQLFDALGKMRTYDEKQLLKKLPGIEKPQLSNLKTHLYKEIMASLRLLKSTDSIDLQLNEQHDYAHILYKKGLLAQSIRIIEKAKDTARAQYKFQHLAQLIALEKRIETLHITGTMLEKADLLAEEAIQVSQRTNSMVKLSNLALQLYAWHIRNGHARDEEDEKGIREFFYGKITASELNPDGFYEALYLYQCFSTYAFIRQDFLMYYRYSQKCVNLFHAEPAMIRVETGNYIKALHNLLNAHFDLRNHKLFEITLQQFKDFAQTDRVLQNDNFRIQCFVYIANAKLNQHFMRGSFKEGLSLLPELEKNIAENELYLDKHRILVFNYKMGLMHLGSGDPGRSIDYLQRIINDSSDLRYDLQCYARLLHLMAHYELGNVELMEPLSRSVYRFMSKKKNFTVVEDEMLKFLRKRLRVNSAAFNTELNGFLQRVKQFEHSRFETRTLAYVDVISWVESKVNRSTISEVIHQKYINSRKRNYKQ